MTMTFSPFKLQNKHEKTWNIPSKIPGNFFHEILLQHRNPPKKLAQIPNGISPMEHIWWFNHQGGIPHSWMFHGKYHLEMDYDWGYPYDSGKKPMKKITMENSPAMAASQGVKDFLDILCGPAKAPTEARGEGRVLESPPKWGRS